jgi:hypothetical protein
MDRPTQVHVWGLILALLFGILAGSISPSPKGEKDAELPLALDDPHGLARRLRGHKLALYYGEEPLGYTAYLTVQPLHIGELQTLVANPSRAAQWKGIVRFVRLPDGISDPLDYGEFGFVLGNLQVFGDPALLRQIRAAVSQD